jgi:hypothetical protein
MILVAFTIFHVLISLVALASGVVVLYGLLTSNRLDGWTNLYIVTIVATSVTGFFFPVHHFMPSHGVGILSLMVLAITILARYRYHLAGGWRRAYAITAVIALYLNFFVLVAQMFGKIPALKALAPTQTEPPFLVTQLTVLIVFIVLGTRAATKFHTGVLPGTRLAAH